MTDDVEWIVPMRLVRDADRPVRPRGLALPLPQRAERVTELRRLIVEGHYASEQMMEAVARRMTDGREV